MTMLAYHNDSAVKDKYLDRVKQHREADELVQSYGYWEDGKGCAVGCTLHGDRHKDYETELGIPEQLALLEDAIFEGLPVELAKQWPERFLSAIKPGVDLSKTWNHFAIWLLRDSELLAITDVNREAIATVIDLHVKSLIEEQPRAAWSAAESAAWSAAWSAARSAARSAAWSAARSAAWSAARSAARSAAESAAESAAWSAAWSAARSAAWSVAYVKMSDKLIELLQAA